MKRINLSLVIIFLVMGACRVAQDIKTPKTQLPEQYRFAASADTTTVADVPRAQFFTDPYLKSLLDSAIANNFDLQLALKNIESAQVVLRQTRFAYLPTATAQVTASSVRPSDNSINGLSSKTFLGTSHIEDYSANVSLSWEADIWGKVKNQRADARAAYLQTEEARKLVQTGIVAAVSEGYYNLLMLDAQLAIAKRNIVLSDSTLKVMRLQFNAGQLTALAVQQAEAQQQSAAALVPQIERAIAQQENALQLLTGRTPDAVTRGTLAAQPTPSDSLEAGVPSALLARRPDIRAQELQLVRANARVGIARANMYPSLTITATGGLNSFRASNWFNIPASLFGVVGGGLTQPIFQKKQLQTAYDLAKIEREKNVISFRQSVLTAVSEVSDALVRINTLRTERAIVQVRVANLEGAVRNAHMLFSNGMATYLEVITAQQGVLQSQLQLAAIDREQLAARVGLYRALGGGWK